MNPDLENILKKAGKFTKTERKFSETSKNFAPSLPYDYLVFTKLVRFAEFNTFLLILIPIFLACGFFFQGYFMEVLFSMIIYSVSLILFKIVNSIRYQIQFIGWQQRLLFSLTGFDEIIRSKKMFCDLCWNDAEIKIILKENSVELEKYLEAALLIFCNQTKKAFYVKKAGSESKTNRKDWKLISTTSCEGSANPEVLRFFKNLLEKELTTIQLQTQAIKEVQISIVSKEFEVPIEINRGNN